MSRRKPAYGLADLWRDRLARMSRSEIHALVEDMLHSREEAGVAEHLVNRKAKELRTGNRTPWYKVIGDARFIQGITDPGEVLFEVQHHDSGGHARRILPADAEVPVIEDIDLERLAE